VHHRHSDLPSLGEGEGDELTVPPFDWREVRKDTSL
jgi:hypothetical protein